MSSQLPTPRTILELSLVQVIVLSESGMLRTAPLFYFLMEILPGTLCPFHPTEIILQQEANGMAPSDCGQSKQAIPTNLENSDQSVHSHFRQMANFLLRHLLKIFAYGISLPLRADRKLSDSMRQKGPPLSLSFLMESK